jgi:S-DNA-T family DNA segregation ATPase FtsK/SpoIIIE
MTTDIRLTLGEGVEVALAKAPHILVAGMTGAGKSVAVHSYLTDLISHPARHVNVVLIDPKRVEFSRYQGIPHLIWPWVAYDIKDADNALKWVEAEMRMRFYHMEKANARDISQMPQPWARLIVFIDELANLVLDGKALSKRIVTIASMGRAAGIHMVLATQRPSADVISPLIRANVPTRVALPTITRSESTVILDQGGAEELEQPGDMLIRLPGQRDLVKTRGIYVSDDVIDATIQRARHL